MLLPLNSAFSPFFLILYHEYWRFSLWALLEDLLNLTNFLKLLSLDSNQREEYPYLLLFCFDSPDRSIRSLDWLLFDGLIIKLHLTFSHHLYFRCWFGKNSFRVHHFFLVYCELQRRTREELPAGWLNGWFFRKYFEEGKIKFYYLYDFSEKLIEFKQRITKKEESLPASKIKSFHTESNNIKKGIFYHEAK